MPEAEVFANQEEIIELVGWLLDQKCEFIPDLHYDSSSPDVTVELATIRNLARSTALSYVLREDFIESPLDMREVTTET
jgi:hypothetical protein